MVAVISHDAGGAEVLSSWLLQNDQEFCLVLGGPAISVFQRKLKNITIISLDKAIILCDWVLCGSSWQSSLEKKAVISAKNAEKKVITFLDHWVNYKQRFQLNGVITPPDEIWVTDKDAKKNAKKIFPDLKITIVENPYMVEIMREIDSSDNLKISKNICSVLYVCEPVSDYAKLAYGDSNYLGYTETNALNFFLKNICWISNKIIKLTIRPHPSEAIDKYNWVINKSPVDTLISNTESLVKQVSKSDVIVGCESMAMVVGLWAKKRVLSSIPVGGMPCQLPHKKIEYLQNIVCK
jgi:hypothetical protein